jgi:serine/threonine protein kinase
VLIKICDLGFSMFGTTISTKDTGTYITLSPEALKKDGRRIDGRKVDVWALGITIYTILAGKYPFWQDETAPQTGRSTKAMENEARKKMYDEITNLAWDKSLVEPGARLLLERIFVRDPNARITVHQVLADTYFQEKIVGSPKGVNDFWANLGFSEDELHPTQLELE